MQLENNHPNTLYMQRIQRAIHCLQQQPELNILVVGGLTAGATISEAEAGRQVLLKAGIAAERITLEDKSQHTLDNLKCARKLLSDQQLLPVFISNRFHLPRVHVLAKGFHIKHYLCAAEDKLPTNMKTFLRLVLESLYIHWYYVGKAFSHITGIRHMLDRIT